MKKTLFALPLLALAILATSFAFAPALPQAIPVQFDESYSFTATYFNECTNEFMELDAQGEYSVRGVINDNRFNFSVHITEKYAGDGYTGIIQSRQSDNGSLVNGQYVGKFTATGILTAAGGGNNIKFTDEFHVTVNAKGEVSVIRGVNTRVCQ